jgi:hypothetical protein
MVDWEAAELCLDLLLVRAHKATAATAQHSLMHDCLQHWQAAVALHVCKLSTEMQGHAFCPSYCSYQREQKCMHCYSHIGHLLAPGSLGYWCIRNG